MEKTEKISIFSSSNGIDWHFRGTAAKENSDIRNPSVFIFPDGKMLLALYKYNVYNEKGICSPSENKSPYNYGLLFFISDDGGKTWKEQGNNNTEKVYAKIGTASPHGRMFFYNDQLLLPVFNKMGCFLLSSNDNGNTWDIFSQIANELLEPFVVKTPNNELAAVMRSGRKSKYGEASLLSFYRNNKWTELVCVTDPLQHPANLLVLADNRLLLTYGDRNFENQRILAKLSKDMGLTWSNALQVGKSFKNCDFGYPSTIEINEGKLITAFYAKQCENPWFYFGNPELYEYLNAYGYYYHWSLELLSEQV